MSTIKTWVKRSDKNEVECYLEIKGAMSVDTNSKVIIIESNDRNIPLGFNSQFKFTESNKEELIRSVEQWAVKNNYQEVSEDYFSYEDKPKNNEN
ncbi:hypothetical protein VU07_01880 [Desulfobulbus sp. F4]|nr:hypothetical protein [Desulfobulbus sp. F4]